MRSFYRSPLLHIAFLALALALPSSHCLHAQSSQPVPSPPDNPEDYESDEETPAAVSFLGVTFTFDSSGSATAQAAFHLSDSSQSPAAEIKSSLQSSLGCSLQDSTRPRDAAFFYSGSCHPPLTASSLLHQGVISTIPLQNFATAHHIPSFTIEIHLPESELLETVPPTDRRVLDSHLLPSAVARHFHSTFIFAATPQQSLPAKIVFRYGYAPVNVRRSMAILAAILLLPLFLLLWLSRKALSADVADKSVVWFGYMRSLAWILNGSLVAWWVALDSLHAEALLRFLFSGPRLAPYLDHPVFTQALGWLPPSILWLLCYRISQPVQQKLRGLAWTKRELTVQAFYSVLAGLFPMAMFLTGLSLLTAGAIASAFYWWLAALLLRVFAVQSLLKHTGMQPQALSIGDLRDRAFTFADRLGVKLQQVYLIPSGKGQMANAFARTGDTIAFTDYLLKRMNQREVDFVLAHELTHLRLKHPIKLGQVRVYSWVFAVTFLIIFGEFFRSAVAARYALVFLILSIVPYFWSRRFEYSADAGAVSATGDPGAAISALFKLSELNMMPTQWSHWREKWLTHPSTLRRANAIAAQAGIPPEQVPQIALQGAAEAPAYSIPATAAPGAKLHSSQRTRSIALQLALALIALFALIPSLFSLAAIHSAPPLNWILFAAAPLVTLAAFLLLSNFAVRLTRGDLVPALKRKFIAQGIQADSWNGFFVNFSPAAAPRLYDGNATWDIGYVFLFSDRLCYWGEEIQFALPQNQVTAIRFADGSPSLLPSKRLYVAWKDDDRNACGVFNVACGNADSALHANRLTEDLARRLEAWWKGSSPASAPFPSQLAGLSSPQVRAVTSQIPASRWNSRKIVAELLWVAIFTAVAASLFGLPFHFNELLIATISPAARKNLAIASPTLGAGWYAVVVAVLTRFLVILPLLRYRDTPKLVAAPPARPSAPPPPSPEPQNAVP
ncbi:MAG TPA: M48 family metalloprotease [Candidatus Acidoferrum sp.]|nr:M48 family metalloprotease [Candidatus Acidoferrum sp.]